MRDSHATSYFGDSWDTEWYFIQDHNFGNWIATAVDVYMSIHVFTPDLEEWLGI
jgi:hypothetical protein